MAPPPVPSPTLGQVLARPALTPTPPWWKPYQSPAALATHLATASAQGKSVYVPAGGRSVATVRSRIKRALKDTTIRDVQIRLRPHGNRGFAVWLTPYFSGLASPNGTRAAARAALRASTPAQFLTKKLPARPRSIRARPATATLSSSAAPPPSRPRRARVKAKARPWSRRAKAKA